MERQIGEIFEHNGEWYQCVVAMQGCRECSFRTQDYCTRHSECISTERSDQTSVVFKKLEKVGKPFYDSNYKQVLQKYKYYTSPIISDSRVHILKLGIVRIEIKQNKEDMEEKKVILEKLAYSLINGKMRLDKFEEEVKELYNISKEIKSTLKPFNLEAAKAGKPVCTRDGRKARIICFDKKDCKRIVALVQDNNETEVLYDYYNDGSVFHSDSDNDLMMFPEKRSGWVNIDWDCNAKRVTIESEEIYDTKEDALRNVSSQTHKDTVKIYWEE